MKKVLVVDDNAEILEVLAIVLEMEGYQVRCCDDGNKITDIVFQFNPDLILLDIMLRELDGRDLCKRLKNSYETKHIPIIMISASHSIYSLGYKDCNADDFIAKPFEINSLVSKVEKHIK